MYKYILVALENSLSDRAVLEHIEPLAKLMGSKLLLVHVADGWGGGGVNAPEPRGSPERRADRAYLEDRCAELTARGFVCGARLALGDPATELVKVAVAEKGDLIPMSPHGPRFFNDLVRGSTADRVRHDVTIPVLLVRAISTYNRVGFGESTDRV